MPPTVSVELSLINDAPPLPPREPLAAIEADQPSADSAAMSQHAYAEAFEGLDSDLLFGADGEQIAAGVRGHGLASQAEEDYGALYAQPARKETHVTFMMAALVLVACVTAGAAVAAFVFTAG